MLNSLNTLIGFVLIMAVVSLVITILVQIVNTLFNLRGQNLVRGVTKAFRTMAPNAFATDKEAEALAKHLLQLPHLSDQAFRAWKTATAVRPNELWDTLLQIANSTGQTDANITAAARELLRGLGIVDDKSAQELDQIFTGLRKAIASQGNSELTAELDQVRNYTVATAQKAVADSVNTAKDAWNQFNFWFEATQDRAQQWFAAQTRAWTIGLAIPAAAIFQLDAVEIYAKISTDSTLRDKLVAAAGTFTTDAEKAIADSAPVLQEVFNDWKNSPEVRNASLSPAQQDALNKLEAAPAETRTSFIARLDQILAPSKGGNDLEKLFATKLDAQADKRLKDEAENFTKFSGELDSTGFQLLTSPFNRWYPLGYFSGLAKHLAGILISAALLSLGAPFWFNILKGLTNLRSLVADKIGKEEDATSATQPPTKPSKDSKN